MKKPRNLSDMMDKVTHAYAGSGYTPGTTLNNMYTKGGGFKPSFHAPPSQREPDPYTDRAACTRGVDPEIFHEKARWAEAAAVCRKCPVTTECLAANLQDPNSFVGGTTPSMRAKMGGAKGWPDVVDLPGCYTNTDVGDSVRAQVLELYEDGYGFKAIGSRLGMSYSTVRRILRNSGINMRSVGGGVFGPREAEVYNLIVKMLREEPDLPVMQLADRIGCNKHYVYEVMRREKIPTAKEKALLARIAENAPADDE